MSFTFRAGPHRTVQANLEAVEAQLLAYLFGQLLDLIGPDEPPAAGADPLAIELGLADLAAEPEHVAPPDDPALARLFPDAYPDDEAAASEFRRFTEGELRAGKRGRAQCALESLPEDKGGRFDLDEEQAQCWLGALNDLRLVLGSRFGLTDDGQEPGADLPGDDPLRAYVPAYHYLGYLQETLLEALPR
ncbi:MAG TPA: DUF2017 domain-containing protein [Actinospica sp.]|nr:DUF2017 domain-containing protein [Actinospica sp.]